MGVFSAQQVLLRTGSFTGYRPEGDLGSHYLEASSKHRELFCPNSEGWGPLSPFRYDLTPCFIDVTIASVAALGLILGPIALWSLLKKKEILVHQAKNNHFWIKQVSI